MRAAAAAPAKAAAKGKKGKGDAQDGPRGPTVPLEIRATTVVGGNILKTGTDPALGADSDYPSWLWGLLDRRAPLSELKRRRVEDMSMGELERLVKLDNGDKIRATNATRAKA